MRKKIALGLIFAAVLVSGPVQAGEQRNSNSGELRYTPVPRNPDAGPGTYQPYYGYQSQRREQGRSDSSYQYDRGYHGYQYDSGRGHGHGGGGGRGKSR